MLERPDRFRLNKSHPLANGLVFAGLAPGGLVGSTLYPDSSLYGKHGTLTSMDPATDWVWDNTLGRFVLDFAGDNDYISCPIFTAAEPLTIAGWIKPDNLTVAQTIASFGDDTTSACFVLYIRGDIPDDPVCALKISDAGTVGVATTPVSPPPVANAWNHTAAVFSSTTSRTAYLNGVGGSAGTTNIAAITPDYFTLGVRRRAAFQNYCDGQLSDVMVWSRVLSGAELSILANPSNVMLGGLLLPPQRRLFRGATLDTHLRFWVGTDTSWNTAANWSKTSGGTGGAGVPTELDDVTVDGQSVQICQLDDHAVCKSFSCTDGDFDLNGYTLTSAAGGTGISVVAPGRFWNGSSAVMAEGSAISVGGGTLTLQGSA